MNQAAVIFDLDGTLIDSIRDLAASGNEVLSRRGLPVHATDAYRIFVGDGMSNLVRRIFPPGQQPAEGPETETVLAEYLEAYGRNWTRTTAIFPGVAALLDELARREIPAGVLSNKAHDFTLRCVDQFLGNWRWDAVLGARDGMPKKPDPAGALEAAAIMEISPSRCFFLGDSDVDMMTANRAGMRAVGVSWGYRPVEELVRFGAETVIDHPMDLVAFL